MSKTFRRNPIARELRSNPMYRQQRMDLKTKYARKPKHKNREEA